MENWLQAWSPTVGESRVKELFKNTFGKVAVGVWCSPGRVNLIGEHVDYNGGPCLPMALPHATYVAVSPRKDRLVKLISAQEEGVREISLDMVGPGKVSGWSAYVVGVAWAMEQAGVATCPGFNIAIDSCVPYGAGLSSSAALEGAVGLALADLCGLDLHSDNLRRELVECCIRAENEIAGANTGGLDQTISLLAKQGHALFVDFLTGDTEYLPFELEKRGLALLVIDTRAPHSLNDGQYANRRNCCEEAAKILGVGCLAEAVNNEILDFSQISDETMKKRVRHVVGEIKRCQQVATVMKSGTLDGERLAIVGKLFNESHESLRNDYEVSCPELDLAVDIARECGAYGARMTGGGFGGSAIVLVDLSKVEVIGKNIAAAFIKQGFTSPQFLVAKAAAAGQRLE